MISDTNKLLPDLSQDLLDELDRLFPEKSATPSDSPNTLYYRGGQRSVINFLKEQYERQNQTILKGE